MKILLYYSFPLLLMLGCNPDDTGGVKMASFQEKFKLEQAQEALITGSSGNTSQDSLSVKVVSIEDSRCPKGGQCIWAGNATVHVDVTDKVHVQEVKLCLGACQVVSGSDTVVFTLSGHSYQLILQDVVPYPETEQMEQTESAVLQIENH